MYSGITFSPEYELFRNAVEMRLGEGGARFSCTHGHNGSSPNVNLLQPMSTHANTIVLKVASSPLSLATSPILAIHSVRVPRPTSEP